jgi:hypothetical protein
MGRDTPQNPVVFAEGFRAGEFGGPVKLPFGALENAFFSGPFVPA